MRNGHLKRVGFWHSNAEPHFPKPVENSDSLTEDERKKVCKYLKSAEKLDAYFGYSWCRICDKEGSAMGCWDMSDGEWLWPEGLAHYVKKHKVKLPDEFVAKCLAG